DEVLSIPIGAGDIEVARRIQREGTDPLMFVGTLDHRPAPLDVPLLDPALETGSVGIPVLLRDIEITHCAHGDGRGIVEIVVPCAIGGNQGPVPLDVPLLDPATSVFGPTFSNVEAAGSVHREGNGPVDL